MPNGRTRINLGRRRRTALIMALSMASVAAVATVLHAAAAPTRVTLAYPSPSPRVAPLWIAQDLDFFGKYGVRPQVVLVRNNQMLTAGLISGDLEVGYTGGTTVLGAAAAGAELKMIANFVSRGKGHLLVRSDIKKPADLAGKRIGVQSIGGTLWMYVMLTLEQLGLDLARDKIRLLIIGDQTVTVRALESQVIDATVLTTRTYIPGLLQKGFNILTEVNPAMAATGMVTRKNYLEKNPALLENVLKALIEGEYFSLAPSGKAQTIKSIMSHLRLSDSASAEEGTRRSCQGVRTQTLPVARRFEEHAAAFGDAKPQTRRRQSGEPDRQLIYPQIRRQRLFRPDAGALSRVSGPDILES